MRAAVRSYCSDSPLQGRPRRFLAGVTLRSRRGLPQGSMRCGPRTVVRGPRDIPRVTQGLLAAQTVLHAADRVLDLALGLVGLAFGLGLGIARHLAGIFLDLALRLLGGALDAVFVHFDSPGWSLG